MHVIVFMHILNYWEIRRLEVDLQSMYIFLKALLSLMFLVNVIEWFNYQFQSTHYLHCSYAITGRAK